MGHCFERCFGISEEKSDTAVCPGTKRSADVLDTSSGSMASTAQPPPHKKTTFEHPGVHLYVQVLYLR